MKQTPVSNLENSFVEVIWEKAQIAKATSLNRLARECAIPHWFDTKTAQVLAGCELQDAVEKLATRYPSFIRAHPQGYTYHESIRFAFWHKWHLENLEKLKEISSRLVEYLEQVIKTLNYPERLDYEYERMYHLITIDPRRGFEELDRLFQLAQDNHQVEACHRLVDWMGEHSNYLPENYYPLLKYYEGELARELKQSALAESIFSEILEIKDLDELVRAKANNSMALSIVSGRKNINNAFNYLNESEKILRGLDNWDWLGQVLYNLSFVSRLAGKREDALEKGEEALEILDTHGQPDNVTWLVRKSRILSELGLVEWLLVKPEQARTRFNEALQIQLSIEAKDPAIETYANLGRLERTSGNWDEAIKQLQNGIQLATETKNQYQMAWAKNALGNVYVEMEDWASALHCFEESQQLFKNVGHQHERGVPLKNLIRVYTVLGKWDLAEKAAEDSLDIFTTHEGRQGEICNSLGELRLIQKRYVDAQANFDRALELSIKVKDRKTEPRVQVNLAELNFILGNLNSARQDAERGLKQSLTYKQLDRATQAVIVLGKIDLIEGDLKQAVDNFLSACKYALEFNPIVYKTTISKIAQTISELRKQQPQLDWQSFFEEIENARNSENDKYASAILEFAKENN